MAYVPQFIPTNTQALQGTLNEYQKAYDTETSRMNQVNDVYSAVPTTNQYDTTEKNRIMTEFQKKTIDELDKKYNYDRANTQYAKELAREITNLRSNPLWSLVKEREQLDKMRQNVMATKGSDYFENFDPSTLTGKDPNQILTQMKSWKPMDKKDLERQVRQNAEEFSKSQIAKPRFWSDPNAPGYKFMEEGVGAKNIDEAKAWLLDPKTGGPEYLKQWIQGTGFENYMNDPEIMNRAINAASSGLVGKYDTTKLTDYEWVANQEANKKVAEQPFNPTVPVSNDPVKVGEYYGKDLTDLQNLNKELSNIDSKISTAPKEELVGLQQERNRLQLQKDKINSLLEEVKSQHPEVVQISKEIVAKPFLGIKGTATGDAVRMGLTAEQVDNIENIVSDYYYTITTGQKLGNTATKEHEIVKEIYRSLKGKELPKPDAQTAEDQQIANNARNMLKEYKRFYKGVGNYKNTGYRENIVDPTEKMLGEGLQLQYSVEDPGDIKSARYNEVRNFSVRNMRNMLPLESEYRKGKGQEWDQDKLAIVNNIMGDQETTINYLYNTEGDALIRLWNPKGEDGKPVKGGTTVTLRVDPKRSDETNGIMKFYFNDTGDERFLSQAFNAIDLAPNKKYNINEKSGYLKSAILDTNMFTPEELDILKNNNMSLTRIKKDGAYYYQVEGLTPTPTIVDNKITLMKAIKQYVSQNK